MNSRGERQSAKEGGKKMDYRRRKKIQLKTPEVIPGGVTVRKGKKGKRKKEKRGEGEALAHALSEKAPRIPGGTGGRRE